MERKIVPQLAEKGVAVCIRHVLSFTFCQGGHRRIVFVVKLAHWRFYMGFRIREKYL
jgi:thymidylate kinase